MLKNNKGFSLVELLGTFVILGVLSTTTIIAVQKYRDKARDENYEALAISSYNAMQNYIMEFGDQEKVTLEELKEKGMLSNLKDPENDGEECNGTVLFKNNAGDSNKLDTGSYWVALCCSNYKMLYKYPEKTKSKINKCDYSKRSSSCEINLSESNWTNKDVTATLTSDNVVSKFNLSKVSADDAKNNASDSGTDTLTISETGSHTVYGYIDNGIEDQSCQATVKIDKTSPKVTVKIYKRTESGEKTGSVIATYASDSTGNLTVTNANHKYLEDDYLSNTYYPNGVYYEFTSSDSESGLKSSLWEYNDKGLSAYGDTTNTSSLDTSSPGSDTHTLSATGKRYAKYTVTDKVGNKTVVKIYANIPKKKVIVNLNGNGSTLTTTQLTCEYNSYDPEKKCTIKFPTVTRIGYNYYGFNEKSTATTGVTEISLSEGTYKYYAITAQIKTVTVNLNGNGLTLEKNKLTCNYDTFSTTKKCTINFPEISKEGYIYYGYNTKSTEKTGVKTVDLSAGTYTYYAITSVLKTVTVNLDGNGTTLDTNKLTCEYDSFATTQKCTINFPDVTRTGWTYKGFNTSKTATTGVKSVALKAGTYNYYAITSKTISITYNYKTDDSSYHNVQNILSSTNSNTSQTFYNTDTAEIEVTLPSLKTMNNITGSNIASLFSKQCWYNESDSNCYTGKVTITDNANFRFALEADSTYINKENKLIVNTTGSAPDLWMRYSDILTNYSKIMNNSTKNENNKIGLTINTKYTIWTGGWGVPNGQSAIWLELYTPSGQGINCESLTVSKASYCSSRGNKSMRVPASGTGYSMAYYLTW